MLLHTHGYFDMQWRTQPFEYACRINITANQINREQKHRNNLQTLLRTRGRFLILGVEMCTNLEGRVFGLSFLTTLARLLSNWSSVKCL